MPSPASDGRRMGGGQILVGQEARDCDECDGWMGGDGALEEVS